MGPIQRPEYGMLVAIHENGHETCQVGQVISAVIGVIEQNHIARVHAAFKKLRNGLHGKR